MTMLTREESDRALNDKLAASNAEAGLRAEVAELQRQIEAAWKLRDMISGYGVAVYRVDYLSDLVSDTQTEIQDREDQLADMRPAERPYYPKVM